MEDSWSVVSQATPSNLYPDTLLYAQIAGDRYSYLPYWLIHACVSRGWIFVTPDYRLIPETTAHSSVDDCVAAYNWVRSSLSHELDVQLASVFLSGSSAGGYLALTTAALVHPPPTALQLVYGMLDPTLARYTTKGENIWNAPPFDTAAYQLWLKEEMPKQKTLTGYSAPNPSDFRIKLMSVFHIDALFPEYMTGEKGLGEKMAREGVQAIPEKHRRLFVTAFGLRKDLPPTVLIHGEDDSAVTIENSKVTATKLRKLGVQVQEEYPNKAEHGFDSRIGRMDVEKDRDAIPAAQSLRNAVDFLTTHAT